MNQVLPTTHPEAAVNPLDNALAKAFDPIAIESHWYPKWEQAGYFKATSDSSKPGYCIQLPPPNVTGTLHMGHAFQQTLMDTLVRYHRMRGDNTNWVVGTDHAGIATQIVVERQLQAEGKSRHDLGREKFIERVWDWKRESGSTITCKCAGWVIRPTGNTLTRKVTRLAISRWTRRCPKRWWKCSCACMNRD